MIDLPGHAEPARHRNHADQIRRLELVVEVDQGAPAHGGEELAEGRHHLRRHHAPALDHQAAALEFGHGALVDLAPARGRAVEPGIVHDHEGAVGGAAHVDLDHLGAEGNRPFGGGARVFRGDDLAVLHPAAAVGDDHDVVAPSIGVGEALEDLSRPARRGRRGRHSRRQDRKNCGQLLEDHLGSLPGADLDGAMCTAVTLR